jgi:hypothetical protein
MHVHEDLPIPEHQSIFGDTWHGVPSPTIPHTHPYPTRFHGPVNTIPAFTLPYREQSWQSPQGNLLQQMRALHGLDGVESLTGSSIVDAVVGGLIGYFSAPQGAHSGAAKERLLWGVGGGLAGLVAGSLGIGAVAGVAVFKRFGG